MSEQEKLFVDDFLSNKREYIETKTEELLRILISFELEKKEIDNQIKIFKAEAKADGVDVNKVSKVFNRLKSRLRTKQEDLNEEDKLEEAITSNQNLMDEIFRLIKPMV